MYMSMYMMLSCCLIRFCFTYAFLRDLEEQEEFVRLVYVCLHVLLLFCYSTWKSRNHLLGWFICAYIFVHIHVLSVCFPTWYPVVYLLLFILVYYCLLLFIVNVVFVFFDLEEQEPFVRLVYMCLHVSLLFTCFACICVYMCCICFSTWKSRNQFGHVATEPPGPLRPGRSITYNII